MKTLVISVDYPLPEDRGNRMRTMHFVRSFKQYGDVDLMCYKSHVPKDSLITPFRKEYYLEMLNDSSSDSSNIISRCYRKWIDCKPWIVNNYGDSVVNFVHDVINNEDYDFILCRYSINAYPLLSLSDKYKKRVILDIDDLISTELYDVVYGNNKKVAEFKAIFDKIVFKRYQMKCLSLGNVIFCSETDRRKMAKHAISCNMHVVPNIIPKQGIPETYQRDGHANKCLLFVGALSYQPNELGILWFIREIFDKLPEKYQDIKLLVVGKSPQDGLRQICSLNPRIELIENPPDVVPYFERSSVVIVPLLVGGGTRIKILEAGNCSRPVITTRLGAYGLNLVEYESVLYFDGLDNFIEKLSWLDSKANYDLLVNRLTDVVNSNYKENAFIAALDKIIKSINNDSK